MNTDSAGNSVCVSSVSILSSAVSSPVFWLQLRRELSAFAKASAFV
jgi:hypothetical protein